MKWTTNCTNCTFIHRTGLSWILANNLSGRKYKEESQEQTGWICWHKLVFDFILRFQCKHWEVRGCWAPQGKGFIDNPFLDWCNMQELMWFNQFQIPCKVWIGGRANVSDELLISGSQSDNISWSHPIR